MEELSRNKNIGDIYRIIYHNKQSSRQELSRSLGLSLPTIDQNLGLLKENGYIYTAGTFQSTGGRKANVLKCTSDARLALGIDITQRHLSIVLIDLDLTIIDSFRTRRIFEDSDDYYRMMKQEAETILNRNPGAGEKLLGVGVALPATIQSDQKTISYMKILTLKDNVYERIQSYLPYPLLLFNDANSAGLAESWVSGSELPMVYLSLSNSVGGANMNGKDIYTGTSWRASEFGHMRIVPSGRRCYCGQSGCLDAYCSAKLLSDFTDGDLKKFFEILKEGTNDGFKQIFDEYLNYLALAVINLRVCYDCDIVLGGNVGSYMADYIDVFRQKVIDLNPFETGADYILVCHYRTEAAAVGAAIYFINDFIQSM